MNIEQLNPEYPEHLNPFRKRRNTLTRSFRGIKNAIVRTLTGKEKEKPVLRPKQANESTIRNVLSLPPTSNKEPPIAFPRSRFSERLSKTDAIRASTLNKKSIFGNSGRNPFDEAEAKELKSINESNNNNEIDPTLLTPPQPAIRSKHKRRKKKAPIPPGSVSGSVSGSKWSLTSTESDMSSMGCYSENDIDYIDRSVCDNEEILNLTRQIAKFTEDTNNNSISNNVDNEVANENEDQKAEDVDSKEVVSTKEAEDAKEVDTKNMTPIAVIVTDENGTDVIEEQETTQVDQKIEGEPEKCNTIDESDSSQVSKSNPKEEASSDSIKELEDIQDDQRIKENTIDEVINSNPKEEASDNEVEDSFVIIKESDANQINENSIITEETDIEKKIEDETIERRVSVKDTIDYFESSTPSPTPKIRKNILTKEKLLGAEDV